MHEWAVELRFEFRLQPCPRIARLDHLEREVFGAALEVKRAALGIQLQPG
jgi:hypothetical protein